MTELRPDCSRCAGLCCVALPFSRGADFPVDKPGGVPCGNLLIDDRCGIHDRLAETGWRGCVTFDCFGAGQRVMQETFRGRTWRDDPDPGLPARMFSVLPVVHQLHHDVQVHRYAHVHRAIVDKNASISLRSVLPPASRAGASSAGCT